MVNIGSGNGLFPDGTKPLTEPMLIKRQLGPPALIQSNIYLNIHDVNLQVLFKIYTFKITATSPRGQWVNLRETYTLSTQIPTVSWMNKWNEQTEHNAIGLKLD